MVKLDYPFNIYRELTRNDYFHFGLWEEDTVSVEQAQDALAELLIGMIPDGSGDVLEIGSGLGKFAAKVAEKGHTVTGIDIDRGKVQYATEKYSGPKTIFLEGDFFEMAEKLDRGCFDTIILFESSQYFADMKALFAACRALLRGKGSIVLCDEIIHSPELKSRTSVKQFDEYLSGLYENGFKIVDHLDIGRKVMPTCRYMVQNLPKLHSHEGTQALLDGWEFQRDMYEKGLFGYVTLEAVKDTYFLGRYVENMEQEVVPAFNETFGVHRSMSHWKWKYKENPFGKEAVVIARDQDRSLVGHYSGYYMPWFSRIDNLTYNIIQGVDTFTVKRVRRIGLGKTGLFARMGRYFFANFCNNRMPFAYGVNTASAHELGKRYLGYRPIEPVGYYCLNPTEITKRRLSKRIFPKRYRVEAIDLFGQEFDQLFHSAVQDFPPLIVKRDSLYLNWRYADPDKS
jgi:SAM-dependent methyltransferase